MTKTEYRKMMTEIKSVYKKGISQMVDENTDILIRYPELWNEIEDTLNCTKKGTITFRDSLMLMGKIVDKAWEKDYSKWIAERETED